MKRIYVVLILLVTATVTMSNNGCGGQDDYNLKLGKGETVTKKFNGQTVTLRVDDIRDSRCPKDVQCIRAGEALVLLTMMNGPGRQTNINLCTGADCKSDNREKPYNVEFDGHTYLFTLTGVEPFPAQANAGAIKKAALTVKILK